jgi:hypothetical protein
MKTGLQEPQLPARNAPPPFRLDVPHDLPKPEAIRPLAPPPHSAPLQQLPEPVFRNIHTSSPTMKRSSRSPTDPYSAIDRAPDLPRHARLDVPLLQITPTPW